MLRVDRCRDMDKLITFKPDPDYSPDAGTGLLSPLSYKRCNAEVYYVGENPTYEYWPPSLQRGVVLKWFYSPRAVGTPLSEVHALYLVHFTFYFRPSYEKQLFGNATDTHSGCMSKLLQFPLYRQSLPGVETGKWRCLFPVLLSITFLVRYFL